VADCTSELIPPDLLSAYLHECRIIKPALSDEAKDTCRDLFSQLRASSPGVCSRVFQTLISLSVARARGEMCLSVRKDHVEDAFEVLVQGSNFTISRYALKKKSKNELVQLTKTLEDQASKGKLIFTRPELVHICHQLGVVNPGRAIASMVDVAILLRPPYPPKSFKFNYQAF